MGDFQIQQIALAICNARICILGREVNPQVMSLSWEYTQDMKR